MQNKYFKIFGKYWLNGPWLLLNFFLFFAVVTRTTTWGFWVAGIMTWLVVAGETVRWFRERGMPQYDVVPLFSPLMFIGLAGSLSISYAQNHPVVEAIMAALFCICFPAEIVRIFQMLRRRTI